MPTAHKLPVGTLVLHITIMAGASLTGVTLVLWQSAGVVHNGVSLAWWMTALLAIGLATAAHWLTRAQQAHALERGNVVEAILLCSEASGIAVAAEEMETRDHARAPHALGCDMRQGYLFSKPAPASDAWRLAWAAGPGLGHREITEGDRNACAIAGKP